MYGKFQALEKAPMGRHQEPRGGTQKALSRVLGKSKTATVIY
jgi:hypothetical protein